MRRLLIYIFVCTCIIGSYNAGADEDTRVLPKGMTEAKLEKSVKRQFKYINSRLLTGKSADKIINSGNTTAIDILNKGRSTSIEIGKKIKNRGFKDAYFDLQDLNNSLKIALKLSRAKDVAIKRAKDDVESARIVSDAYLDRAKQLNIDAGKGGNQALKNFNLAVNLRSKASALESNDSFDEAKRLFDEATDKLKAAIEITKERASFDLQFKLTELRKENKRRMQEAESLGINKGDTGRTALVTYEHAVEKLAECDDLVDAHEYKSAIARLEESNRLLIKSIKQGKFYLSKNNKTSLTSQSSGKATSMPDIFDYE